MLGQIKPALRKAKGKQGTHSVEMPAIPELAGHSILTLDLGRRTGWAMVTKDVEDSGVHELYSEKSGLRSYEDGVRFSGFERWLTAMDEAHGGFDVLAFEVVHPKTHRSSRQSQIYAGFRATLMSWCHLRGRILLPVPVQTIKKAITTRGNAKKEEVIAALRELGYSPFDDNEADAIGLLLTLYVLPALIGQQVAIDQKTVDAVRAVAYTAQLDQEAKNAGSLRGDGQGQRQKKGVGLRKSPRRSRRQGPFRPPPRGRDLSTGPPL